MLLTNQIVPLQISEPVRSELSLLTITISAIVWTGASQLIATFSPILDQPYSITAIPAPPTNYVITVRFTTNGVTVRAKLWSTGTEVLYWPLYGYSSLPVDAVYELWTCSNTDSELITDQVDLEIGILTLPELNGWNVIPTVVTTTIEGVPYV